MKPLRCMKAVIVIAAVLFALPAAADYPGSVSKEDVKDVFKKPGILPTIP